MILTRHQREERARIVRYVMLLGPRPCPICGGSMLTETDGDEVGWACILCPNRHTWSAQENGDYSHIRRSKWCRKLSMAVAPQVFRRFEEGARQIDIVMEFGLNRQTVARLRLAWEARHEAAEDVSA